MRRFWIGLLALAAVALFCGRSGEPAAAQPSVQELNAPALDVDAVRRELLAVINAQRARVGAPPVVLDDLANRVADAHARDMAQYNYLSHWNREGLPPYLRFALQGGTDYSAENVSMFSGLSPRATPAEIAATILRLHNLMHDEKPPNDGHRRTILNPEHTHVGLGFAVVGKELRMAQEFLSRYVRLEPPPTKARPTERLTIVGQVLEPSEFACYGAVVHHEPLPQPMTLDQLRQPRPYTLPEKARLLKPRPQDGAQYTDGTTGEIDVDPRGRFQFELTFPEQERGVYTTVVFVQRGTRGKPFPAAAFSVWVE
ncbi:MAG: CAP domain-containing protein [Chloracidobacterium sp.]|nr:CAP domain-containing protein [Chloracidobacterium sp.]MDW8218083.1 CAP domain-containing protein [Acidobacteriota bacterium]